MNAPEAASNVIAKKAESSSDSTLEEDFSKYDPKVFDAFQNRWKIITKKLEKLKSKKERLLEEKKYVENQISRMKLDKARHDKAVDDEATKKRMKLRQEKREEQERRKQVLLDKKEKEKTKEEPEKERERARTETARWRADYIREKGYNFKTNDLNIDHFLYGGWTKENIQALLGLGGTGQTMEFFKDTDKAMEFIVDTACKFCQKISHRTHDCQLKIEHDEKEKAKKEQEIKKEQEKKEKAEQERVAKEERDAEIRKRQKEIQDFQSRCRVNLIKERGENFTIDDFQLKDEESLGKIWLYDEIELLFNLYYPERENRSYEYSQNMIGILVTRACAYCRRISHRSNSNECPFTVKEEKKQYQQEKEKEQNKQETEKKQEETVEKSDTEKRKLELTLWIARRENRLKLIEERWENFTVDDFKLGNEEEFGKQWLYDEVEILLHKAHPEKKGQSLPFKCSDDVIKFLIRESCTYCKKISHRSHSCPDNIKHILQEVKDQEKKAQEEEQQKNRSIARIEYIKERGSNLTTDDLDFLNGKNFGAWFQNELNALSEIISSNAKGDDASTFKTLVWDKGTIRAAKSYACEFCKRISHRTHECQLKIKHDEKKAEQLKEERRKAQRENRLKLIEEKGDNFTVDDFKITNWEKFGHDWLYDEIDIMFNKMYSEKKGSFLFTIDGLIEFLVKKSCIHCKKIFHRSDSCPTNVKAEIKEEKVEKIKQEDVGAKENAKLQDEVRKSDLRMKLIISKMKNFKRTDLLLDEKIYGEWDEQNYDHLLKINGSGFDFNYFKNKGYAWDFLNSTACKFCDRISHRTGNCSFGRTQENTDREDIEKQNNQKVKRSKAIKETGKDFRVSDFNLETDERYGQWDREDLLQLLDLCNLSHTGVNGARCWMRGLSRDALITSMKETACKYCKRISHRSLDCMNINSPQLIEEKRAAARQEFIKERGANFTIQDFNSHSRPEFGPWNDLDLEMILNIARSDVNKIFNSNPNRSHMMNVAEFIVGHCCSRCHRISHKTKECTFDSLYTINRMLDTRIEKDIKAEQIKEKKVKEKEIKEEIKAEEIKEEIVAEKKEKSEIDIIKEIVGIKEGVDYSDPENVKQLRYQKILCTNDKETNDKEDAHFKQLTDLFVVLSILNNHQVKDNK